MRGDHACDRYLKEEGDMLIFGCINPFCCHGSLGLPNHIKIPKETKTVSMKVLSHKDRYLELELTVKKQSGSHKIGDKITLKCHDDLYSCKLEYEKLFPKETTS